ncbi:MAG: glycerol kinase [Betaproteobacteria bacterium HGW-Betaproteobacteria-14]|nr:MAG: glycerol kinase [Betaproteobacteria bacterium HGW-Betaproteobacteria-14]
MNCLLALDQGTTSSRAIVFDGGGRMRALAQKELRQHYPRPGWVEHDPLDIWRDQLAVAQEAVARAGLKARDIAALGITNQRETTLLWERSSGKPVHPAIVWQDRRTAEACAKLKADGVEALVRKKTGLVIDPYFSATKLAWLLDQVPGARERAQRGELAFGTVDSWLVWNLTGGRLHVTDVTNASRTLLFDIHRGDWDAELLALFNIPCEVLPRVVRSSALLGETASGLFDDPIALGGMAGDQQAALFGQACHGEGMAKNTYGTGCFLLMHTGARPVASQNGLVTTCAAQTGADPEYALEGSVFIGGAVVQWLRDGLGLIRQAADIEPLAASVPDAGGVVFVPAFAGLGAPHWNPNARGTLVGLTRGTGAAHIARAALESIAFQSAELALAMQADCGRPLAELRVDGGAAANGLLMQFQADLLGVPVVRPRILETTALGAAYLAGLAAGVWKNRGEIAAHWAQEQAFAPSQPRAAAEARLAQWQRAVRCTLTFAE